MKGDFTRDTFDPLKHFSQVLMQQGRVTLDADANEQSAILLRYVRRLARDIIGPYAAPAGPGGGFLLGDDDDGLFTISKGSYYVDGILVENDLDHCTYLNQPDFPVPDDDPFLKVSGGNAAPTFWIYLDVWERHITALEDDAIREKALNGPDTCTRAQVVWQVKALAETDQVKREREEATKKIEEDLNARYAARIKLQAQFNAATDEEKLKLFPTLLAMDEQLARFSRLSFLPLHEKLFSHLVPLSKATLAARVDPGITTENACVTSPESKYRGLENHLYRVEIHRGGKVGDKNNPPTFKWSRDNGSVATAWLGNDGNSLQVTATRGFTAENWVELCDDTTELLGKPGTVVQLTKVGDGMLTVDPSITLPERSTFPVNPKVRRWDHNKTQKTSATFVDGAWEIQEPAAGGKLWIDLEDGLQIQFSRGGEYHTGDYWLIPARVATGKIEWPGADELNPQPLPPHGVQHHFALLGSVQWANEKMEIGNQRFEFLPLLARNLDTAVIAGQRDVVRPHGAQASHETNPKRRVRTTTAGRAGT